MRTQQKGLVHYARSRATPGFTLFSPLVQDQVYLLNMSGEVIHEWTVRGNAYGYAYLLPNGHLLASSVPDSTAENDREGLRHLVELDWNSDVIWQADAPGWWLLLNGTAVKNFSIAMMIPYLNTLSRGQINQRLAASRGALQSNLTLGNLTPGR